MCRDGSRIGHFRARARKRSNQVLAAAVVAAFTCVVVTGAPAFAAGTSVVSETFSNAAVTSPNSWVVPPAPAPPNEACLTAGTNTSQTPIPGCALNPPDPAGSGVLRLTSAQQNQEGGVLTSTSEPASSGLDASFDSYQYGGSAADGIGFVINAENPADPEPPATIGQPGGDLGYAAGSGHSASGGLADGYLGIGLDVFGNYSNTQFDGTGCTDPSWAHPSINAGQVVVRGPGNNQVGYCLLNSSFNVYGGSQALRGANRSVSEVPVEVVINTTSGAVTMTGPAFGSNSVPAGDYGVAWTPVGGTPKFLAGPLPSTANGGIPAGVYPSSWINPTTGIPYQLGFGFTASTGGSTDIHEVSTITVNTLQPVPVLTTSITDSDNHQLPLGGAVAYTVDNGVSSTAANENAQITSTTTLASGLTPGSASGTGWTCMTTGQTVTCTFQPPVAAGTELPGITIPATVASNASTTPGGLTAATTVSSNDGAPATATDRGTGVMNPTLTGEAYGLSVSATLLGTTLLNVPPVSDTGFISSTTPLSTTTPCDANVGVPGLLGATAICGNVTITEPAQSTATSGVANVTLGVPLIPAIDIQGVQAQSTTTCSGSTGSTTIAYLRIGSTVVIAKPTTIAPNTTITVGVVTLVLNQQTAVTTPDRGLQVNAVALTANVANLVTLNLYVSSAESDIGNC